MELIKKNVEKFFKYVFFSHQPNIPVRPLAPGHNTAIENLPIFV